jgi:hypothetical protein
MALRVYKVKRIGEGMEGKYRIYGVYDADTKQFLEAVKVPADEKDVEQYVRDWMAILDKEVVNVEPDDSKE